MGEPPYTKIWQRQEMQTENNNYNKQAFFLDLFSIFGPAVEQGWKFQLHGPQLHCIWASNDEPVAANHHHA